MNFYNWELRKLIVCSSDELKSLQVDVEFFVAAADKVRREGLLSLEDDIPTNKFPSDRNSIFQEGLHLIVNGTDTEIVHDILKKRILFGGKTGVELRRELIIMEGILAIQSGIHPHLVGKILISFLSPEIPDSFKNRNNNNK